MKTSFTLFIGLVFVLPVNSEAQQLDKNKVARMWYGQFRHIKTLRVQTTSIINDLKHNLSDETKQKFVFSGGKYRAEIEWPQVLSSPEKLKKGYLTNSIGVFNGVTYSRIDILNQGSKIFSGKKSVKLNSPGFQPINVEVLYFDESLSDYNWIQRMQRQSLWTDVARRITSVSGGRRKGMVGYWVSLNFRGSKVTLFLNSEYYPVYKKIVRNGIKWEMNIQSQRYVVDGFPVFIPSRVETVVTDVSGIVDSKSLDTLDKPAQINKPIRNSSALFAITKAQGTLVYNVDTY